jgi:hypothetical protein
LKDVLKTLEAKIILQNEIPEVNEDSTLKE